MAHDPNRQAAAFLGGALDPASSRAFSEHLLGCDDCWREVQTARRGRALAESARALAPAGLRERVRALVLAEQIVAVRSSSGRARAPWRGRRVGTAVGAVALMVVTAVAVLMAGPYTGPRRDPAPLAAAVADFRGHELPGRQLPTTGAPDLSRLRLLPVGAGAGRYGALNVDGYAYRDPAGRRLTVYLSAQPFPSPPGARWLKGADGPWSARRDDVVMLCARDPHALLVVGQDATLVRQAAAALGVL